MFDCVKGQHDEEILTDLRTHWCRRCGAIGITQKDNNIAWRIPVYLGTPELRLAKALQTQRELRERIPLDEKTEESEEPEQQDPEATIEPE
jgi:hypothetical protein